MELFIIALGMIILAAFATLANEVGVDSGTCRTIPIARRIPSASPDRPSPDNRRR